jgi:hypothetical protein
MNESKTMSNRNDPEVVKRMEGLQQDNTGIAKRALHDRIVKSVLPAWKRKYRTTKGWPVHLCELEAQYEPRVFWPRSVYKFATLRAQIERFRETAARADSEYSINIAALLSRMNVVPKTSHALDVTGKDLSKAAALPKFGTKRDQLGAARQYVESIKSKNQLSSMYSIIPGYRTQQSPPDEPKVRLINMVPISTWIMELEMARSTIDATVAKCKEKDVPSDFSFFYCDKDTLYEKFAARETQASCVVVMDSTQYDSTVQATEIQTIYKSLWPEYSHTQLLADYACEASIVMPSGDVERRGGIPSGSVTTNFVDGITNVADLQEAYERAGLWKWLTSVIVNGDDIILFFSTRIRKDNVEKVSRYSRRELNPDKSDIKPNTAWFSKQYLDPTLEGPCTVGFRVLNSLMFKEHQRNPITGAREYVAIATSQQIEDMKHHPEGEYFSRLVKAEDKYPVESFTDDELREAAEEYLKDHRYEVEHGQLPDSVPDFIAKVKSSFYATT